MDTERYGDNDGAVRDHAAPQWVRAALEADPVVVVGMGAVTPLGVGVSTYWNELIAGHCGIGPITSIPETDLEWLTVRIAAEVKPFNLEAFMSKKLIRQTDAFSRYAYVAAAEALAGQEFEDKGRVGIVMATAMGGVVPVANGQATFDKALQDGKRPKTSARFVPRVLSNIAASLIAIDYGITGPSVTVSTACSSGNDALILGATQLLIGACDTVLCVGADSNLTAVVIDSLTNARALCTKNDDPLHSCRPFDRERSGFVLGEGGGALLLERASTARRRGVRPLAALLGWASNNDAYSVVAPEPDGTLIYQCMNTALAHAGCSPADVDYVNAHGTSTIVGDEVEAHALLRVFSDGCRPWVSSTKGATGHLMAAGGITEAIACIKALNTGCLPPSLNLENPIADLHFAQPGDTDHRIRVAMSNAFGFGGQNATIILSRLE